jgi:hypothetical protein
MPRYRKKPVVIDAIRFTGSNTDEIAELLQWEVVEDGDKYATELIIETLEGNMTAQVGDWVVRGIKGEGYPVKPDIFEATYELVET